MKACRHLGIALLVLLVVTRVATGQPATIHGLVVDDSGGPLPGVAVVLTTDNGGNPRETTTDKVGAFSFRDVPEGTSQVHAELAGFLPADLKMSGNSGREHVVTVRMKVGFAETVTVSAESGGGVLGPARNADSVEFDAESLRRQIGRASCRERVCLAV